jgi:amino acid permease
MRTQSGRISRTRKTRCVCECAYECVCLCAYVCVNDADAVIAFIENKENHVCVYVCVYERLSMRSCMCVIFAMVSFIHTIKTTKQQMRVSEEARYYTQTGVSGVPFFIVRGQAFSGAQPASAFVSLFKQLLKKAPRV